MTWGPKMAPKPPNVRGTPAKPGRPSIPGMTSEKVHPGQGPLQPHHAVAAGHDHLRDGPAHRRSGRDQGRGGRRYDVPERDQEAVGPGQERSRAIPELHRQSPEGRLRPLLREVSARQGDLLRAATELAQARVRGVRHLDRARGPAGDAVGVEGEHLVGQRRQDARAHRAVHSRVLRRHGLDRKSTRLNSSHITISYAVFCLKKKKKTILYITHKKKKKIITKKQR